MSQTKAQLIDNLVSPITGALGSASAPTFSFTTDPNTGIYSPGADQLAVTTGGTGRLFIDSLGRLLAGTSTARSNFFGTTLSSITQIEGTGGAAGRGALSVINNDVSNNPPYVLLGRSGAATLGSNAVVVSGSRLGTLTFHGADGTSFIEAATVAGEVDGTPGANDMPGRLVLSTTSDGASSPTERLRIDSSGRVGVGTSSPGALLHVSGGRTYLGSSDGYELAFARTGNYFYWYNDGGNISGKLSLTTSAGAGGGEIITFTQDTKRVGIGTTSPDTVLTLNVPTVTTGFDRLLRFYRNQAGGYGSSDVSQYYNSGSDYGLSIGLGQTSEANGNTAITFSRTTSTTGDIRFISSGQEGMRLDSSRRLLVGTSTARGDFFNTSGRAPAFQIEGTSTDAYGMSITANSTGDNGAEINLAKSRGTNTGSSTIVANGDTLARISFQGADGSELVAAAYIQADVDGTPGANDMPGRLTFSTTTDGASSPTERMRIDSVGAVLFKKTTKNYTTEGTVIAQGASSGADTSFVTAGGTVATFARSTNDGTIISLRQDGTEEGTISVSGTTVSYNGGHLSRWSQLPSGTERTEILRGSVLSNIDEMCEWGDEENEQLNRMKVSDVEGDKNVSGVFQCWDDDDDTYTNDFYCAMTGDFIIRIAAGTTVERGDLLMSAGDGTAKPQDDDIIRSKTIAKVTSTNVSCTYEDGSYCVPCVLMAC